MAKLKVVRGIVTTAQTSTVSETKQAGRGEHAQVLRRPPIISMSGWMWMAATLR